MACQYSRRQILRRSILVGSAAAALAPRFLSATPAPAARVAIARCKSYGPDVLPTLARMFEQLGGIGALVRGKTVAVKLNLTGSPAYRLGYLPAERAHWTHPDVIGAAIHLFGQAG